MREKEVNGHKDDFFDHYENTKNFNLWKQFLFHTVDADVMLAVSLSRHVNSDARVASRVWHFGIFNLQ